MKYLSENIVMKTAVPLNQDGRLSVNLTTYPTLKEKPQPGDIKNIFNGNVYIQKGQTHFPFLISDLLRDAYKTSNNGFVNYFDNNIYGELPSTYDTHLPDIEGVSNWRQYNDRYFLTADVKVSNSRDSVNTIEQVFPANLPIGAGRSKVADYIVSNALAWPADQNPVYVPLIQLNTESYEIGSALVPHIPNKRTTNMFASVAWYFNEAIYDEMGQEVGELHKDWFYSSYVSTPGVLHDEFFPVEHSNTIGYFTIDLKRLLERFEIPEKATEDATIKGAYIRLASYRDSRLLHIDCGDNIAEYYVAWLDDSYAFQCQPFIGKAVVSESYDKKTTIDSMDIAHIQYTDVDKKWNLSSNYLTDGEYRNYNSLLRSPYIYLYNTKTDKGYYCEIEDKQATNKTYINDGMKYFNVKLRQRNKERM